MTQFNGQISMGLFKVMDISTKQVAGSGKGYYHMDLQDTERNTISAIVPDKVFMTTRTEEDESGNMIESNVRKFNISDAVYAKLRYSVKGEPMLDKNGDDLLDENGGCRLHTSTGYSAFNISKRDKSEYLEDRQSGFNMADLAKAFSMLK